MGVLSAATLLVGTVSTADAADAASSSAPGSGNGWQRTYVDDFSGALDTGDWSRYEGRAAGDPSTTWQREQVSVSDGKLVLRSQKTSAGWRSGGVSNARAGSQRYGKWLIRFRADAGDGLGYVFLLYPQGGGWPPEVDIAENGGGDKRDVLGALHYDDAQGTHQRVHKRLSGVDFTQWHTVGVETSPGKIVWTLDGRAWATAWTSGVPDESMWLGLQSMVETRCSGTARLCVNSSTPRSADVEVDWVARYKRS
ncbi:family 16 glycosylhydrolase [Kineococcus sp. GCM10028916]